MHAQRVSEEIIGTPDWWDLSLLKSVDLDFLYFRFHGLILPMKFLFLRSWTGCVGYNRILSPWQLAWLSAQAPWNFRSEVDHAHWARWRNIYDDWSLYLCFTSCTCNGIPGFKTGKSFSFFQMAHQSGGTARPPRLHSSVNLSKYFPCVTISITTVHVLFIVKVVSPKINM